MGNRVHDEVLNGTMGQLDNTRNTPDATMEKSPRSRGARRPSASSASTLAVNAQEPYNGHTKSPNKNVAVSKHQRSKRNTHLKREREGKPEKATNTGESGSGEPALPSSKRTRTSGQNRKAKVESSSSSSASDCTSPVASNGTRTPQSRKKTKSRTSTPSTSSGPDQETGRRSSRTANRPKVHFRDLDDPWVIVQQQHKFMTPEKTTKRKSAETSQKSDGVSSPKKKSSTNSASSQQLSSSHRGLLHYPPALDEYRKKMQSLLRRVRWNQSFIEAWENTGFRNRQQGRIMDAKSMKKCEQAISKLKKDILNVLQQIEAYNDGLPKEGASRDQNDQNCKLSEESREDDDDDDGVHFSDFCCCVCGSEEDDEDNDILMCDGEGCNRCFHQKCCNPPVSEQEKGDDDSDWFCRRCLCLGDVIRAINETFDIDVDNSAELCELWASALAAAESSHSEIEETASRDRDSRNGPSSVASEVSSSSSTTGSRLRNKGPVDYLSLNLIYFGQSADELEGSPENEDKKQLAGLYSEDSSSRRNYSQDGEETSSTDNEYVPPADYEDEGSTDSSSSSEEDEESSDTSDNDAEEHKGAQKQVATQPPGNSILDSVENGDWDDEDEESFAPSGSEDDNSEAESDGDEDESS
eukprot:gb/GECG01016151.1/.p1 GENE.gb/GECG01016151.1/~~gb/GECG01016151.1/.p1  ORF type:complete len:639 (+),score=127.08 gb/GECG01016151.1/:1-1917(+)